MDKTDEKSYCMLSHTNPPTSTYPASITTNRTSMGGVEAGTGEAHAWGGGGSADGRRRRGPRRQMQGGTPRPRGKSSKRHGRDLDGGGGGSEGGG